MKDEIFDDIAIEKVCQATFGLKLSIAEVIARRVPTSYISEATIFKTAQGAVYVLIRAQGNLLLADVIKMLRGMNVEVDEYLPPHGDKDYFKRIGIEKFNAMFPGRPIMRDDDLRYYQTLAPYHPALVRLSKIKSEIRGLHFESKQWRKVKAYSFSKLKLEI